MKKITAIFITLILISSPVLTYANESHNDDTDNSHDNSEYVNYSHSEFSSDSDSESRVVITSSNDNDNENHNYNHNDNSYDSQENNDNDDDSDCVTPPSNTAPVITLIGDNPIVIPANVIFVDPGATANDTEDGDITSSIIVSGTIDTSTEGTYTLMYTVTDSDGASVSVMRDVQVFLDNPGSGSNNNTSFKLIATKIVCDNASDLPNWGVGGADVNADTATDFLTAHTNCHLESGWNFEWGYSNVTNPGDAFIGEASSGWTTFGATGADGIASTTISTSTAPSLVWVREVVKEGYAPYYGIYDSNNAPSNIESAGIYCYSDVLNFDNFDFVSNPTNGGTYYCVALGSKLAVTPPDGGGNTNTPPTITLIGANPFEVATDTAFIDPGATANDTEDGNITSNIVVTGSVDASTTGSYILTYSVTDSGGLSTSTTRTIIINSTTPIIPPVVVPPTTTTTTNTGGGGSGGGIGGHRHDITNLLTGSVLGASTECSYLRDYLRKDLNNDKIEVLKLQSFLNVFEGENLPYDGVFGESTFEAVNRFQNKYIGDILTPWGHTAPTGYVYILTKKKINEIYCNSLITLNSTDQNEINNYRTNNIGNNVPGTDASNSVGSTKPETVNSTNTIGSIIDISKAGIVSFASSTKSVVKGDGVRNLAISLLGMPKGLGEVSSTYLLIILAIILIITYAMKSGDNTKPESIITLGGDVENKIEPGVMAENDNENNDDTDGPSSNNSAGTGFKGIIG